MARLNPLLRALQPIAVAICLAAVCAPAFAQKDAAPEYNWTPEQFTAENYYIGMVSIVGHAMTADFATANQCGVLMYARIDATSGRERLVNAAIWTAYLVRGGDLRSAGAEVTPEMDALIRIPITPNGLNTPVAQAFFARVRATPGGIEARTAECIQAFDAAAGETRRYFEQRADYLTRAH